MFYDQGNLLIVMAEPFLTRIKILDEQHRGIVSIINALHYALYAGHRDTIMEPTAAMIMGYTRIHFETEMDLLEESGYSKRAEHQELHEELINDFERIAAAAGYFKADGDPMELLEFLKHWWKNHITIEDMAYGAHLKEYLLSGRRVIVKRG